MTSMQMSIVVAVLLSALVLAHATNDSASASVNLGDLHVKDVTIEPVSLLVKEAEVLDILLQVRARAWICYIVGDHQRIKKINIFPLF